MADSNAMQTVQNSTGDSPRELIAAYLNSKGMPLTNANYALALKGNSENPGMIPGLVNMDTVSSPGDPGMPARSGVGSGGSPSARRSDPPPRSFEGATPTARPERGGDQRAADRTDNATAATGMSDIGALVASILGLTGLGGAASYFGRPNPLQVEGKPGVAPTRAPPPAPVGATGATTSAVGQGGSSPQTVGQRPPQVSTTGSGTTALDATGRPMLPQVPPAAAADPLANAITRGVEVPPPLTVPEPPPVAPTAKPRVRVRARIKL